MKRVTVHDTPAGHAVGWNPDGANTSFNIEDPDFAANDMSIAAIAMDNGVVCSVTNFLPGLNQFTVGCVTAPQDTSTLHYIVTNLPAHIVT